MFSDEQSKSHAYRQFFIVGLFLAFHDGTMDVGNAVLKLRNDPSGGHDILMNVRNDDLGVHDIAVNVGNDGVRVCDIMADVGNDGTGVHDIVMNFGNDHTCVHRKFCLEAYS